MMNKVLVKLLFAALQLSVVCSADTLLGYLWNGSSIQTFYYPGVNPHQTPTTADAINDNGQIVGTAGPALGFIKTGSSYSSFDFGAGVLLPSAINNQGTVVGSYYGNPIGSSGPFGIYGFTWNGQQAVSFEAPPTNGLVSSTAFTGINDQGSIVGYYEVATVPETIYSFLLQGSSYTPIAVPGGSDTEVLGIDNNNDIVGVYKNANGDMQGFLKNGSSYELSVAGSLTTGGLVYSGGPANISVYDIPTARFLDQSALMAALQKGPYSYSFNGFNDAQEAVGNADIFSLVPEPGSLGLFGIAGIAGLAALYKRRSSDRSSI